MREIFHFKNHFRSDLTAANIGVHKSDWVKARNSDNKVQSYNTMKRDLFDVLPIVNRDNSVTHYWHTVKWGDFSLICNEPEVIANDDKIYYLTTIKDLIRSFAINDKDFFFLKEIDNIVGLVTISHLNYKQVYLYIYEYIIEFEMGLGKMILAHKSDNFYIENTLNSLSNSRDSIWKSSSLKRYKNDTKTGMNASIIEYLFLPELVQIFCKYKLHMKLGYNDEKVFLRMYDNIHALRNTIAHSVKSLIRKKEDVKILFQVIQNLETLNQKINKIINKLNG